MRRSLTLPWHLSFSVIFGEAVITGKQNVTGFGWWERKKRLPHRVLSTHSILKEFISLFVSLILHSHCLIFQSKGIWLISKKKLPSVVTGLTVILSPFLFLCVCGAMNILLLSFLEKLPSRCLIVQTYLQNVT